MPNEQSCPKSPSPSSSPIGGVAGSQGGASSPPWGLLRRLAEVTRGESIHAVARRLRMNQETIRRALQGESRPSGEFLQAICREYNLSAHWLFFGTGPKFADEVEGTRPRTFMRVAAELRARADEIAVMITELELQIARDRESIPNDLDVIGRLSAENFELRQPKPDRRMRNRRFLD